MAIDTNQPFLWGSGGRRLTPEEILLERKEANALGQQAMATTPVGHWSAGLNRVLQGLLSGYDQNVASQAADRNAAESSAVIQALIGQAGGSPIAPITVPTSAPSVSTPMGNASIPSGTIDPRLSEAISGAAAANGIDPAYMTRLALVENGGKIEGTSSLSSATGPFQFINSTAKQYGLTNPNDPAAAASAAARLTLDNKAALTQALGRDPTPGELYLAHQQGAGGAVKLLANPDAPVESVIGVQAARNNGATPGMTAGQFASKWTNKFSDLGVPQIVDANQPSPLDTAQYPAGPVGAPVVAADGSDPAALPTNAQPVQGVLPTAQSVQAASQPARAAINPAILQAMTSPYVNDQTRQIATLLFKQQMDQQAKASDPMRQLQMQKLQADISAGKSPESVREFEYARANGFGGSFQDWIASKRAGAGEYSLTPVYGKDAQGNTVLIQPGKSGTAVQTKLPEGVTISSGVDKIDLGTQWGIIDKRTGQIVGYQPKDLKGAESAKAEGKAQGAAVSEYQSITSKMPGLEKVVQDLDELSNRATYTMAGQAFDAGVRQLGFAPRDAAVARAEYTAKVDNQVLPLLRDTFGAQFTEREGATLRATLGDPNKSPQEKQAVLRAFIEQKRRDIEALASRTGQPAPQQKQGTKRLRFNPTTGALE